MSCGPSPQGHSVPLNHASKGEGSEEEGGAGTKGEELTARELRSEPYKAVSLVHSTAF